MTWREMLLSLQIEAERSYGAPIRLAAYRAKAEEDALAAGVKAAIEGHPPDRS